MEKGFCASHDFLHHVSRSIILFSSFSSRFKAIEIFLVALPPPHNTISPCYCATFYCSLKSSWYTTHQYPRPSSLHRFFFPHTQKIILPGVIGNLSAGKLTLYVSLRERFKSLGYRVSLANAVKGFWSRCRQENPDIFCPGFSGGVLWRSRLQILIKIQIASCKFTSTCKTLRFGR